MNTQRQTTRCFEWRQQFSANSVGLRVALAVNFLVIVCGLSFLIFDYLQESRQRIADKALALRDQAMTLHQALAGLGKRSVTDQQQFIDAVCGRMSDDDSPGHHIVVEINGKALQSQAHHRDSDEQLLAMRVAGEQTANGVWKSALLVGKHAESGITVYIGEQMANVLVEIRRQALVRSVGVGLFGLVLAIAVNLVIRQLVHKPLRRLVSTIDDITAGNYRKTEGRFDGVELARVAAAVDSMSLSLASAEAHRNAALDRARKVQQSLLPQNSGGNGLEISFFHRAAEEVAGDYLDVFQTARGTSILCVADVVGHGIAPAMIAAILKVLLLNAAEVYGDPRDMLDMVNRRLIAVNLPDAFATMFLAEWSPATQRLRYANAGHEPALLVSKNSAPIQLSSTGPMVGIDNRISWESRDFLVAQGDLLACWTDGITEARNDKDELLGRARLIAAIERRSFASAREMLDAIDLTLMEHISEQPVCDDCTVLAIRFV